MNKRDRDNLKFLLSISPEAFTEWLNQASPDDIDYALEIINQAKNEHRSKRIIEHLEMQEVTAMHDDDMKEAKQVINKIIQGIKNGNT